MIPPTPDTPDVAAYELALRVVSEAIAETPDGADERAYVANIVKHVAAALRACQQERDALRQRVSELEATNS